MANAPASSTPAPIDVIRSAAVNSGFYSKIFTQGANGISSTQLVMELRQLLKLAGITLPEGVAVSLDTLQILLAGGQLASDLATNAATLACVGDISEGVAGLGLLLVDLGMGQPMSQVVDWATLVANAVMIVTSLGGNVLADVGFVISAINCVNDLGPDLFGSNTDAANYAQNNLMGKLQSYITPQIDSASALCLQYHQGKIDLFDLIGGVALTAPTQFAGLFPGLATFFPSWTIETVTGFGFSGGLLSNSTATTAADFYKLVTTKAQVQAVLINQYITIPMTPFESFNTVAPVISMKAISALALLLSSGTVGDTAISFDFNVIGAMRGLGLTPYWLGDDWLFKGLQRNETDISDWDTHLPYPPLTLPYVQAANSGIVSNGATLVTPSEAIQNQQAAELASLQKLMQYYDQIGDIESLLQIPEAVAMLKRWANLHVDPTFYTLTQYQLDWAAYNAQVEELTAEIGQVNVLAQTQAVNNSTLLQLKKELADLVSPKIVVGEITNMKLTGASITTQSWYSPGMSTDPATPAGMQFWTFVNANYALDFSDYWKCLNVLDTMEKSNLFADKENVLDKFGSIDAISAQFNTTYQYMTAKQLNLLARKQLAQNLGIPLNQLATRTDSNNNLIFYQKAS